MTLRRSDNTLCEPVVETVVLRGSYTCDPEAFEFVYEMDNAPDRQFTVRHDSWEPYERHSGTVLISLDLHHPPELVSQTGRMFRPTHRQLDSCRLHPTSEDPDSPVFFTGQDLRFTHINSDTNEESKNYYSIPGDRSYLGRDLSETAWDTLRPMFTDMALDGSLKAPVERGQLRVPVRLSGALLCASSRMGSSYKWLLPASEVVKTLPDGTTVMGLSSTVSEWGFKGDHHGSNIWDDVTFNDRGFVARWRVRPDSKRLDRRARSRIASAAFFCFVSEDLCVAGYEDLNLNPSFYKGMTYTLENRDSPLPADSEEASYRRAAHRSQMIGNARFGRHAGHWAWHRSPYNHDNMVRVWVPNPPAPTDVDTSSDSEE